MNQIERENVGEAIEAAYLAGYDAGLYVGRRNNNQYAAGTVDLVQAEQLKMANILGQSLQSMSTGLNAVADAMNGLLRGSR